MENPICSTNSIPYQISNTIISQNSEKSVGESSSKVHDFVKAFLVIATTGVSIGCFVVAVVINPIFLIPGIITIALAVFSGQALFSDDDETIDVKKQSKIPKIPQRPLAPYVPGQPIGIRNAFANCWVNSALHFVLDLASYDPIRKEIREIKKGADGYALKTLIDTYEANQGETKRISTCNSQTVRQWLSSHNQEISNLSSKQEDTAAFFEHLLSWMEVALPIEQKFTVSNNVTTPPTRYIDLALDVEDLDKTEINFNSLLNAYFNTPTVCNRSNVLGVIEKRFTSSPDEFLLIIRRFVRTPEGERLKVNAQVNVPMQLNLTPYAKDSTTPDSNYDYVCDGIIKHSSPILQSGHYTAIIQKNDSSSNSRTWYLNDGYAGPATEEDITNMSQTGYIYHFTKKNRSDAAQIPATNGANHTSSHKSAQSTPKSLFNTNGHGSASNGGSLHKQKVSQPKSSFPLFSKPSPKVNSHNQRTAYKNYEVVKNKIIEDFNFFNFESVHQCSLDFKISQGNRTLSEIIRTVESKEMKLTPERIAEEIQSALDQYLPANGIIPVKIDWKFIIFPMNDASRTTNGTATINA